ncbi:MAG: hypothetical protein FJ387_04665 [Verrucomicrobia bacterium]|nr:hypothetical protein [Verrucomicrobiota bacterium]
MEKHFLSAFVEGTERESPKPWYNPDGDCIVYQFGDEAIVADRVDEILTIYRSVETGKSIGYQIKGVCALGRKFGRDTLIVNCRQDREELKEISLCWLLLAAYEDGPKTIGRRQAYSDALEYCGPHPRLTTRDLDLVPA